MIENKDIDREVEELGIIYNILVRHNWETANRMMNYIFDRVKPEGERGTLPSSEETP